MNITELSTENQDTPADPAAILAPAAGDEPWHHERVKTAERDSVKDEFGPIAERLAEVAGDMPGTFIIASFGVNPETGERIHRVEHILNGPDAANRMITVAKKLAQQPGANVYVLPALMRPGLAEGRKGGVEDVVGVLALVVDFDRHRGPAIDYTARLPASPHFVIETSPGNFHVWFFFDAPQKKLDVQPILNSLVAESGADPSGAEVSHVFRVPGCRNWPSEKKIRENRPLAPALAKVVEDASGLSAYSVAALRDAIEQKWPNSSYRQSSRQQAAREHVRREQKVPVPSSELIAILRHLPPDVARNRGPGEFDWFRAIAGIRATRLRGVPDDQADEHLLEIACAWSRGDFTGDRPANYIDDDDVAATFWTAPPRPGGTTFGTLYKAARANGYVDLPPGPTDTEKYGEPNAWFLTGPERTEHEEDDEGFPMFDTWEFKDRPPPSWQIEGLIRDKSLTIIYGASEAFKTFLLIDLLASTATATPAFGQYSVIRSGDVVLCLDEDPDDAMRGRFPAWCKARGIADPFGTPLCTPDGEPAPGRYVVTPRVPLVADPDAINKLIRQIHRRGLRPAIIGIDTAAKAMVGLNQNDAKDVGLLIKAMTHLRREFDCSVVAVHHPKKEDPRQMRGSGAFTNDIDAVILANRIGDSLTVELTFEKLKSAEKPKSPICVKGVLYETGLTDTNGRPYRYPAFTHANAADAREARAAVRPRDRAEEAEIAAKRRLVIDTLCRITKSEADPASTRMLAMEMYPKEKGEAAEDYDYRIKHEIDELGRCAKGAKSSRRGKRPDLSDLIKMAKNGSPLRNNRSLQFFVPDAIRTEYNAF